MIVVSNEDNGDISDGGNEADDEMNWWTLRNNDENSSSSSQHSNESSDVDEYDPLIASVWNAEQSPRGERVAAGADSSTFFDDVVLETDERQSIFDNEINTVDAVYCTSPEMDFCNDEGT